MKDIVLSRPIANLSNVEVVRHVPHRWLISQWAKVGRLSDPAMAPYVFEPAGIDLPRSIVTRVDGPAERPRLLILYYGPLLAEATGGDEHGRYLDETLSDRTRDETLALYDLCRETRRPVYSIACANDENGVPVDYERLLLPFTGEDDKVNCIFTTTLLISAEGRFVRNGIFSHADFPPPAVVMHSIQVSQDMA